jgi:sulfatase maturation enzyme AslB (radical SAM superfamily)
MPALEEIGTLGVVLTAECNLRCAYCYQNAKKPLRMTWGTLRTALDLALASRSGTLDLYFTGGEPLLEFPTMRRAVEYVEANRPPGKQVRYGITTNGTLVTPEIASFLEDRLFDVMLSFDGIAGAQDFRGPGTFAALDRLLDRLRTRHADFYRWNVTICMTVAPSTAAHLPASVDYFLGKDAQKISVSPSFIPDPSWSVERIAELERAFDLVAESSLRHARTTGKVPVLAFRNRGGQTGCTEERPMCGIAQGNGFAVDVDGQAYGCVTIAGSYQEFASPFMRERMDPMRMGSIHDPAFPERFASFPEAVRRAGMFHGKENKHSIYRRCAECDLFASCSVCPASIGHLPGNTDPDRMNDFCCAFNLASLKHRRRFPRERTPHDLRRASAGLSEIMGRWKSLEETVRIAGRRG